MMPAQRIHIDNLPPEAVSTLAGDSFFASHGFMNLWRTMNGQPVFYVIKENDTIQALCPGIEFGKKPLSRFQAMPDGCYARLFVDSDANITAKSVSEKIMRAIAHSGYVKCHIYDFFNSFTVRDLFNVQGCRTNLVDISELDWSPPDKKLQSEIRKAARENVEIMPFHKGSHFDKFIPLMLQSEKRHNRKPKYPAMFFEALADLAAHDSRVLWYWCEHDNQPVTSHINFIEETMVINWQVYFDKQFSFLKANQYLLDHLVKTVTTRGVKSLNLGASPPDAEGLAVYKSKWGGETRRYNCYVRRSAIGRLLQ